MTSHSASTAHLVPEAHPAHALLSVAHALLCPANTIASNAEKHEQNDPNPLPIERVTMPADLRDVVDAINDPNLLPIEQVTMPTDDVSDLRDVVDAINRLCETMKTSGYEEAEYEDVVETSWHNVEAMAVMGDEPVAELVSPEEVAIDKVETHMAERWSDAIPETVTDNEQTVCFEPQSELYYTASEVSLLSDIETPDRVQDEDRVRDDRQNVIAGHVAAMRERFESMTRANTPCPELARSLSPSLDLFRNVTPSPDRLD